MKFSVCIDMMFSALDFYDRIAAVKDCGIDAVEFWRWSNKDINKMKQKLSQYGMSVSVFNLDSTDENLSNRLSRGILNTRSTEELKRAIEESAPVYHELGASGMIVLVGENIKGASYDAQLNQMGESLINIAAVAEEKGVNLFVEPLNSTDRENYFMPWSQPLFNLLREVGSPNVKLLYDIYHQQMTEGGIIDRIRRNIDLIGHFHVADCPGRHEPGTGELNYPNILSEIERLQFAGYVGLEYRATKADSETLRFMSEVNYG